VIDSALQAIDLAEPETLEAVQALDQLARVHARAAVLSGNPPGAA